MAKKQFQSAEAGSEKGINPLVRLVRYLEDAKGELRKITWPTLKETRKATLAVLGFVAVMAVILGLVDLGLSSLIKTILS
ncbi:MAG: preprotein translocase subunit SecE [Candidatus Desulfovibrio kirbyi]|jgi:preprotein translocase subunit SecE|uniref:Protein translocase subunit SecE n=1 Tax=Candidatus Desulfovibrio kirbyi TaxID=2696086 RepID=A0A6L2R761_9BACT|nr:preprotein translocase subunit SecE [Desulfovibrio sp.]GFH63327.1 MAG: preprotein translocase subunit SecE [Candidatus Desulfovibrio kirbyi]